MSADFYSCNNYGESLYEEYVGNCSKCGHHLCTYCLVNKDFDSRYAYDYNVRFDGSKEQMEEYGFDESCNYEIGDVIYDAGIDSKYCPFCNVLKIHDDELLEFAIRRLNTNKSDLIESYKKSRK